MTLQDIAALGGILTILATALGWIFKRWVLDIMSTRLEKRIDERTYPIQSDANGGASLPDAIKLIHSFKREVNDRFDKIEDRQLTIGDMTTANNALLSNHLDWHNQRD